jgi:hypothetical protein
MNKKQTKRIVPRFPTEAEEADWWYKNRHIHGKMMLAAVRSGEAQILTREKLLARMEGIEEEAGAGRGVANSGCRPGPGSKAGRTERAAVPDLHQVITTRDADRARGAEGWVKTPRSAV